MIAEKWLVRVDRRMHLNHIEIKMIRSQEGKMIQGDSLNLFYLSEKKVKNCEDTRCDGNTW